MIGCIEQLILFQDIEQFSFTFEAHDMHIRRDTDPVLEPVLINHKQCTATRAHAQRFRLQTKTTQLHDGLLASTGKPRTVARQPSQCWRVSSTAATSYKAPHNLDESRATCRATQQYNMCRSRGGEGVGHRLVRVLYLPVGTKARHQTSFWEARGVNTITV